MDVVERIVHLAQPVLQDLGEADQDGQADPAELELLRKLHQVDEALRIFGGMDEHMPVLANREVALPPSGDVIQLGGIGCGPALGWVADGGGLSHFQRQLSAPLSSSSADTSGITRMA